MTLRDVFLKHLLYKQKNTLVLSFAVSRVQTFMRVLTFTDLHLITLVYKVTLITLVFTFAVKG